MRSSLLILISLILSNCATPQKPKEDWAPHMFVIVDGKLQRGDGSFGRANEVFGCDTEFARTQVCMLKGDFYEMFRQCKKAKEEKPWFRFW